MKFCYVPRKFRAAALGVIDQANEILDDYAGADYDLTLRQLYYQFVARGLIDNNIREYKNLQSTINDARLAGLIDWNAITDNTRSLNDFGYYDISTPEEVLNSASEHHEKNRWEKQPYYCEVWIEKDALIGPIKGICEELKVPYYATKGNNSQSEQHAAAARFIEKIQDGKEVVLFLMTDHDPTGIDMERDNRQRLEMFIEAKVDVRFEVRRLALNMSQIKKYKPPHNPAKQTDSRYAAYVKKVGTDKSWELDALKPEVISELIRESVDGLIDRQLWDEVEEEEEAEKEVFRAAVRRLKGSEE